MVDTPPAPELPESITQTIAAEANPATKAASSLRLRDVFELWKVSPRAGGEALDIKSIKTAKRIVAQFEDVLGDPPLVKLTRADGLKFRDFLRKDEGLSAKTTNDRLGYVTRLLRFEMREHQRIVSNPWAEIHVAGSSEPVQVIKDIKPAKLAALFEQPLFQAYALPPQRTAGRDAAYWIPLLGLYIGARVTEIAQLLVADIRMVDGLWCISILADGEKLEWQSIKNKPSKRLIPMHPELIRLGLPEYAEELRKAGHDRLFPMAPVSDLNNAGGPFGTWFSKLKQKTGWGRENVFHSFRHTVETVLKRKEMNLYKINAYTGHQQTGGGAGVGYTHPEPRDLVKVAEAVQHEGLELPKVFPPPGWGPPALLDGILKTQPRAPKPVKPKRPPGRPKKSESTPQRGGSEGSAGTAA